jgi:6-phosphogluconolactonase
MKRTITTCSNKTEMAHHLGQKFLELSLNEVPANIALSGGNTPKAIFEILAHDFKNKIDWTNLRFFWVDERCVPPSHHESNFGMTREHLFDQVATKADHIFRIKGELSPEEAADDYIEVLDEEVPLLDDFPQFDLVLLGLGDDGHTASIFPHQMGLWESENYCELAQHPLSGQFRITLTGQVINQARQIMVVVTGKGKAEIVKEVIEQTGNYESYPASLIRQENCTWLLDQAAASQLQD